MWWISYRGEGGSRPGQHRRLRGRRHAAQGAPPRSSTRRRPRTRCNIARGFATESATISTSPTPGAGTATSRATAAAATPSTSPRCWPTTQHVRGDGPPVRPRVRRRRPPLRLLPGHQHRARACVPKTLQAGAGGARTCASTFPDGKFLPGTFVASSARPPALSPATARRSTSPRPLGLKVVLDVHGKPRHSVRGIVVHRKHLYVADEAGDAVKVFELKTGTTRGAHRRAAHAAQARASGPARRDALHRRGRHRQHARPTTFRDASAAQASTRRASSIDGKLEAPSGFAIGPDGDLYVAERFDQRRPALLARRGRRRGAFIDGLPDMPEFLVNVPDLGND